MARTIPLMFTNWAPGWRPNQAYTELGQVSARDWLNCIVTQEGYLTVRAGSDRTHTTALDDVPFSLWKSYYLRQGAADYGYLFVVEDHILYSDDNGATWNDFATVLNPGSSSQNRSYFHAQADHWVFAGNGANGQIFALKIDADPPEGYNFYLETPAAPTQSVIAGGSVDDGDHLYKIVYVREESGVIVAFSEPGASVTATTGGGNNTVRLAGIADPTDGQITHKYIYRTKAGEETPYYYVSKIVVGVSDTVDDSQADASLPIATTFNGGYMPTTGSLPDSKLLYNFQPDWRHCLLQNNRLHVVEPDDNTIYLSYYNADLVNPERYLRNFADSFTVGERQQPITGLVPLTGRSFAVVFPEGIHVVYTDPVAANYGVQPTQVKMGSLASRSIVQGDGGMVYYLGSDKQIYAFDGSVERPISLDIQPELDSIEDEDLNNACATWYRAEYRLSYRASGASVNNRTVIYNPRKGQWRKESHGANDFCVVRQVGGSTDDHGELYAAMATEKYVRQLETGTDDNGTAIDCLWESNDLRADEIAEFLKVVKAVVETQAAGTIDVTVTVDGTAHTLELTPSSRTDYWGQRGGLDARGDVFRFKIEGSPLPTIEKAGFEALPRKIR